MRFTLWPTRKTYITGKILNAAIYYCFTKEFGLVHLIRPQCEKLANHVLILHFTGNLEWLLANSE